jgi:hypothetical protein
MGNVRAQNILTQKKETGTNDIEIDFMLFFAYAPNKQ